MRSLSITAIATVAALLVSSSAATAQVKDYRDIKAPALRSFSAVQPKRIVLPNGMVIFLQEDHELPLIRGSARIRGGSRDVPAAKAGLGYLYGGSWRTGGTEKYSGDQLDELLEARAARLETSGGEDSTNVSLNVLKDDFDTVFPLFVDLLRNPAFRQDKIDLAKTQLNTAISRRNDDASNITTREALRIGYGADSPYARQAEYSTVASITREDLLEFHKRFVHPNNIILGLVGDFDSAKMEQTLRNAFASLPRGPQAPAAPAVATQPKPGIYFVAKSDVNQSNIALVAPGTTRNNPDYYALLVMNEILGGGFSGRLMNHLRTQRGLAYGVSGGVGSEWDHPGLFRGWIGTKSGSTLEAVEAMRAEVRDLVEKPYATDELSAAKDAILNAFVFTMDSKFKVLLQAMTLEFYGYPADWYRRYVAGVEKVTADDVARVAKQYVNPNQLAVLVVGNEKEFEKPLSSLGTVTPIDITIPEPGAKPATPGTPTSTSGAAATPATGSNTEGVALAQKVLAFAGGKAKIDAVQAIRTTGTLNSKTPQGDMQIEVESTMRYPGAQRSVLKTPMGEMTQVISADAAFMLTPMGPRDMPGSQRDMQLAEMKGETIYVLKNIDNPKYTFTAGATETIGGVQARALAVNADGTSSTWWVDPATGRILRKVGQARGPMPGEQITEYVEWRDVNGVKIPATTTITRGGEKVGEMHVTNAEMNPAIDPKAWEKPATPQP